MKKFLIPLLFISALLIVPDLASAQVSTFRDVAGVFVRFINGIVALLFASLGVAMLYGVAMYLINSDNEKKREEIKGYLLWGIIGITVVFGMWGILQILCDTLDWCSTAGIVFISPPTQ